MIPQVLESKFSDISKNVATKYSCNYLIAVIIIDLNLQNFSVDTTNLQYIYIQDVQNLGFAPIIDSNVYW